MGQEYRYRENDEDYNQWYYDEYSGLYRQNARTNQQRPSLAHERSSGVSSAMSLSQSGMTYTISRSLLLPWPGSVSQVKEWVQIARQSKDPKAKIRLCKRHASTLLVHSDSAKETVRQAMMRECLRMLKRLSMGQGIGKGGDSEAQFMLANCFGMGLLGLAENHAKAFQWYVQASKQSHPEATYRTAVCHELGIGTRKDGNRAMMFYRKAAHLAHVGSMYKIGVILLRGYYNTAPSPREAISWLQRAANYPRDQVPYALHALAMIQLTGEVGNSTSMIADPAYAMELLHQAAQDGYVPSQVQLGRCYEQGLWVQMDDALSIYWYARAAELDNPEGCMALSGWYLTGSTSKGVLQASDREAYLWARRAATTMAQATEKGTLAKAHFAVAVYTQRGIGVPKDLPKSIKWMRRAAFLGHESAQKYMTAYTEAERKRAEAQQPLMITQCDSSSSTSSSTTDNTPKKEPTKTRLNVHCSIM
ncbi:HCP-like protein [Hesseltinella vesiculosa]|uniref:HCP-like protein n=1 Tax=Hesseltinella vesiculosa TaxID=101127 RepID=A0A1X2GTJ3_9FUNG|nr:HCP-like protein [Hesseltinella vesiculosa]